MADVAKRVYGPAQPGVGDAVLYTAPAGGAVIRSIHAFNTDAIPKTISLAINGTAATQANCWLYTYSIPSLVPYDWSGFLVLAGGDTIHGLQATATAITVSISGIEL